MRIKFQLFLALLALTCPMLVQAALSIQGSRVIYEEARGEAIVQLQQVGEAPGLVQVWLDRGDDTIAPQMQDIPFLITPSVSRIEPGSGQSIRILRVRDDGLPRDRESMFFMNVLEVPPAPANAVAAGDNFIQFSSRARSKFFYRPRGLKLQPDRAHQLLGFSLVDDGGQVQVKINNPSPYHVTFKALKLLQSDAGGGTPVAELGGLVGIEARTVAPASDVLMPMDLTAPSLPVSGLTVSFEVVGDYGNLIPGQGVLD